ncbi:MAG: hypothetical protein HY394_05745 [Candidatus Diapherotrites archaeon]|nr:hypothetical protein [Candidatus Diapherotrites archaeon]
MISAHLRNLARIRGKIASGEPVKIGVFCSGNSGRSPLAEHALRAELQALGIPAEVFSFGVSVTPSRIIPTNAGASERTIAYGVEHGYAEIAGHQRTYVDDAKRDIAQADLLLGISPEHSATLVRSIVDGESNPGSKEAQQRIAERLARIWTLKGFANRTDWQGAFEPLVRAIAGGVSQKRAVQNPDSLPKTPEGDAEYLRIMQDIERTAKRAARRIAGKRGKPARPHSAQHGGRR